MKDWKIFESEANGLSLIGDNRYGRYLCEGSYLQMWHLYIIIDELYEIKVYGKFDVKDKIVIDVGSYYGESACYFFQRGASKVICYEPFNSGSFIMMNCRLNGFNNVDVYRNPITGVHEKVHIFQGAPNYGGTTLENYSNPNAPEVQALSLEDIAVQDSILKMDCEGYEFRSFKEASKETIRKFSAIMIEYHKDKGEVSELKAKLEESVFKVEYDDHYPNTGMLYAERLPE